MTEVALCMAPVLVAIAVSRETGQHDSVLDAPVKDAVVLWSGHLVEDRADSRGGLALQGYLAHEKTHPPRTLQGLLEIKDTHHPGTLR